MGEKHTWKKRLLAATSGAAVVAVAAGGVAMASTPSTPTSSASSSTSASTSAGSAGTAVSKADARQEIRWLARHTVHAELIVHTSSGYKTVDVDRGKLTAGNTKVLTIQRPDGPSVSADITSSTKFRGLPESKLRKGDTVVIVQTGGNAIVVWSRPPAPASSTTPAS